MPTTTSAAPAPGTLSGPASGSRPGTAWILGMGSATPATRATQEQILAFMERSLLASHPPGKVPLGLLRRIYRRSGIDRRHTVISDYVAESPAENAFYPRVESLEPFPSTAARMAAFEREATALAVEAGRAALADAGVTAASVTHLVVSTCTGFFAPGIDVTLLQSLGLRSSVGRSMLGFMGCYAGVSGMATCAQVIKADPTAVVLQVAVELCTLHFQKDLNPDTLVANAIFADGASAAVYSGGDLGRTRAIAPARVIGSHSDLSAGSRESMSWRIGDTGFVMRLGSDLPGLVHGVVASFVDELAHRAGIEALEIDGWVVHPGGRKILEAVEGAMGLSGSALESSHSVLRDFGNMSSATILFVLRRELARLAGSGGSRRLAVLAFGPGLTIEGAVVEVG